MFCKGTAIATASVRTTPISAHISVDCFQKHSLPVLTVCNAKTLLIYLTSRQLFNNRFVEISRSFPFFALTV